MTDMPEIHTSEHIPDNTVLLAPDPPLCPQDAAHGPMRLLMPGEENLAARARTLPPPLWLCGRCWAHQEADWRQFATVTGLATAQLPETAPEQVPVEVVKNEPPQVNLAQAAAVKDRQAKPDPGSLRLELRAYAMVHTSSGPRAGAFVTSRAAWSTDFGVGALIVLCWTEHGREHEAVIAEATPPDNGVKDISHLVSVAVRPVRQTDSTTNGKDDNT